MSTPRYSSVEDYLDKQDPVKAATLRAIIKLILAQAPDLEAKISWNVPTIHRRGKYVAGLAAYQRHLTIAPWSQEIMDDFKVKGRLAAYVSFKNCFQIPIDWKVDKALIEEIVSSRLAELDQDSGSPS